MADYDLIRRLERERRMEEHMKKRRINGNTNRVVTYDANPDDINDDEEDENEKSLREKIKERREQRKENAIKDEGLEIYKRLLDEDVEDLLMIMESEDQSAGIKSGADEMAPAGTQWVYVFCVNAKLITTRIIKHFTKQPYNHVALSFDKSLTNMCSFSIGGGHNGFVRENYKTVYRPDATFSLYKIAVPNDAIIVMKDAIKNIEMLKDPKEKYKYSFKGLLGFVDTRHKDLYNSNERKMFCSQFVARMFATAGMKLFGDKKDYEIRPYDFARNKNFKYCYRGMIKNYDPRRVR